MQFARIAIVFMLGLSVLAGCGGSGDTGQTAKNGPLTIAVIPKGATHEHWKSVHVGAMQASRDFGVEVIWSASFKEDDREEQLQVYETLVARRASAIAIAPIDDRVFVRAVREAKSFGIPTVVFDSGLDGNDHISYIATNNRKGGVLGAELVGKLLGGKGTIVVLRYMEGSAATTLREEGFLATIQEKFPDIEVLTSNQYAGATTESAYRTCENVFTRFDTFDAVWTPNETSTFGCLRALQYRGLAGNVVFVGFDVTDKLIDAMRAGELQGLSIQDPFTMGYESVKVAAAHLRGEPYEKEIDTGVYLATPDNMDDPHIHALMTHTVMQYLMEKGQ